MFHKIKQFLLQGIALIMIPPGQAMVLKIINLQQK
jgi:hypothetical protein